MKVQIHRRGYTLGTGEVPAKDITSRCVHVVGVQIQVHLHGYTFGTGEVPARDSTSGPCTCTRTRTRTRTHTGTRTRVNTEKVPTKDRLRVQIERINKMPR